jgi:hypothetical protein
VKSKETLNVNWQVSETQKLENSKNENSQSEDEKRKDTELQSFWTLKSIAKA